MNKKLYDYVLVHYSYRHRSGKRKDEKEGFKIPGIPNVSSTYKFFGGV